MSPWAGLPSQPAYSQSNPVVDKSPIQEKCHANQKRDDSRAIQILRSNAGLQVGCSLRSRKLTHTLAGRCALNNNLLQPLDAAIQIFEGARELCQIGIQGLPGNLDAQSVRYETNYGERLRAAD